MSLGKEYYEEKIIDLCKSLNEKNFEILKKLGVTVESTVCSAYEYEILKAQVLQYYIEDDYDEEDLKYVKSLKEVMVTQEEYDELMGKLSKIEELVYARTY